MSSMTITPLHVDVLVHCGIHGPEGATNWTSLVDDPDVVGRSLFSTGSAGRKEYVHRPLPFKLTAAEILKACAFYRYNSSRSSSFITRLRDDVGLYVEGSDQAPWGWTADDVTDRLDRTPLRVGTRRNPKVEELIESFAAAGLRLKFSEHPPPGLQYAFSAGRRSPILGIGRVAQQRTGVSSPWVVLADNSKAAEKAWLWAIGLSIEHYGRDHLRKWGNLIVGTSTRRESPRPDQRDDAAEFLFQSWGTPEREWSTSAPARQRVDIKSHTRAVRIANFTHGGTVIARTSEELDRLAASVLDEEMRVAVAQVDPNLHSVIVFAGDDRIDDLASVQLHDAAWWGGENGALNTFLEIQCTPPTDWAVFATVVICDRLVEMPDKIRMHHPGDHRYARSGSLYSEQPYRV